MDANDFVNFESSKFGVILDMPPNKLNEFRLELNSLPVKTDPNYQVLNRVREKLQIYFENHEGLNKYIERELAVKYGRDFSV